MNSYVLILSSIYDFSVDLVVQRLENMHENYIRLNKEQFHLYEISLNPVDMLLHINGNGIDVSISKIKSIWYRQPVFLRNTPGKLIDIEEQLSKSQWSAFLRGLMVFDDAYWMNWPQATYAAESKPYQLMLAKKIGFTVPKTIISNGLGFKYLEKDSFVVKSIDTVLLKENDDCYFTYTSRMSSENFINAQTKSAPITFQEYVDDKLDIRVTVVGDKIFAVSIKRDGNFIEGDWRVTEKINLEYDDICLPDRVKDMCFSYLKVLGLNYGAIDFIKSHDDFFFIEINPTGEWGWLSNADRQIDKEIACRLMAGNS
ncbi:hypothetical protein [Aeromonas allosaccharophila]|uniref:hypothetical protein n=1 Tax=Aeromonas allosaccharophila TaxID=656 RepID=UPI003D216EDB